MNRLYWLNDQGLWELVFEDKAENVVMLMAARRLHNETTEGVVGYARYANTKEVNPETGGTVWWSEYTRYEGGSKRATRHPDDVPKPIKLLEMFHEPHASS